jgi:hypothetical protein
MGDPCPNQMPPWMRTGEGGLTEIAKGLEQDSAVTYLRTTQRVPKDTFLTTFGEASIIRASEPEGKQIGILYERIQRTPSLQKCQYTVKAPMDTPKDHVWIVPQPDKLILCATACPDVAQSRRGLWVCPSESSSTTCESPFESLDLTRARTHVPTLMLQTK